jgi:hypothetical protein
MKTWREIAAPIVGRVIEEVGCSDMVALRRHMKEAYPFGERKYWPYKVWCSEVRRQLRRKGGDYLKENPLPLFE